MFLLNRLGYTVRIVTFLFISVFIFEYFFILFMFRNVWFSCNFDKDLLYFFLVFFRVCGGGKALYSYVVVWVLHCNLWTNSTKQNTVLVNKITKLHYMQYNLKLQLIPSLWALEYHGNDLISQPHYILRDDTISWHVEFLTSFSYMIWPLLSRYFCFSSLFYRFYSTYKFIIIFSTKKNSLEF